MPPPSIYGSRTLPCYRPILKDGFMPDNALNDRDMKQFAEEYMEMKLRFRKLNELLPVLLSDALFLLFSDRSWERKFMVKMWELLKIYSEDKISELENTRNYPGNYTRRDGPVPIRFGLNFLEFAIPELVHEHMAFDYRWKDDEYRYAILALRVLNAQPQFHGDEYRKSLHAKCPQGQQEKTCGELLPALFDSPGSGAFHSYQPDKNQFACQYCGAHTSVFTFIAVAEQNNYHGGLMWTKQPKLDSAIQYHVEQPLSFDRFWRLISETLAQGRENWDTANEWGMAKLWGPLGQAGNGHRHQIRSHFNDKKAKQIKRDIALFHETRNQLLVKKEPKEESVAPAEPLAAPDHNQYKQSDEPRVDYDLCDSDDSDSDICETDGPGESELGNKKTDLGEGTAKLDDADDLYTANGHPDDQAIPPQKVKVEVAPPSEKVRQDMPTSVGSKVKQGDVKPDLKRIKEEVPGIDDGRKKVKKVKVEV